MKLLREPGRGALEPLDLALDPLLGDPGGALHHLPRELGQLAVEPLGLAAELAHQLLAGALGGLAEALLLAFVSFSLHQLSMPLGSSWLRRTGCRFRRLQALLAPGSRTAACEPMTRRDRRAAHGLPCAAWSTRPGQAPGPSSPLEPARLAGALALLSVAWAWWAWQEGAYFGVVLLPGTILLCAGAALLVRFAPWRCRRCGLSPPVAIALAALAALGGLGAALGALEPGARRRDRRRPADRSSTRSASASGSGSATCSAPRMKLSLVPLAAAGAFAGAGDGGRRSRPADDAAGPARGRDGTLDFPLGYRNAEAAFFAIALFPALGLAADRELDWRLRAAALATATLCIDLFLLAQSRGSMPAIVVALVVYVLAVPAAAARAELAGARRAAGARRSSPPLISLYDAADDGLAGVVDEMHRAGVDRRGDGRDRRSALGAAGGALRGPPARARQRLRAPPTGASRRGWSRSAIRARGRRSSPRSATRSTGSATAPTSSATAARPTSPTESSRFTFNAGSDRYDVWRVALDDAGDEPAVRRRRRRLPVQLPAQARGRRPRTLHDAHSVELELLAELGVVGLGAAGRGRGRRDGRDRARPRALGPAAAGPRAPIALASGSYWLVHASVDWFWPYPALTAPVLALLGLGLRAGRPGARAALDAAVARLADRRARGARDQRDPAVALGALRQQRLRDLAHRPRARLRRPRPRAAAEPAQRRPAARRGRDRPRRRRPRAGARRASARPPSVRPEEWAAHYLLAELQADADPARRPQRDPGRARAQPALGPRRRRWPSELGVDPDTGALSSG